MFSVYQYVNHGVRTLLYIFFVLFDCVFPRYVCVHFVYGKLMWGCGIVNSYVWERDHLLVYVGSVSIYIEILEIIPLRLWFSIWEGNKNLILVLIWKFIIFLRWWYEVLGFGTVCVLGWNFRIWNRVFGFRNSGSHFCLITTIYILLIFHKKLTNIN